MARKRKSSGTFCALPWIHLATHPSGGITPCCQANHSMKASFARDFSSEGDRFFSLGKDSIVSAFNSDSFRQIRMQMLEGKEPSVCSPCFDCERSGVSSLRQSQTYKYAFSEENAREITAADGRVQIDFQFLELRLGNRCNLKCRTCNPNASSKWRADYSRLEKELSFVRSFPEQEDYSWPERNEVWEELFGLSPGLKTIYINGGEPMLNEMHFEFLEKIVSSGMAGSIELIYSTNMTPPPEKVLNLWNRFKKVEVLASIDDLEERNRYIRHPADWSTILASLETYRSHDIPVRILQTVSAMNFYYLGKFHHWACSQGFDVGLNPVVDPDYLAPSALPLTVRHSILSSFVDDLPVQHFMALTKRYGAREAVPGKWEQFREYTRALDRIRGESFREVFPEFCDLVASLGFDF